MVYMDEHCKATQFKRLELGTFLLVGTCRYGDDVDGEIMEVGIIKTNEFGGNIYTVYSRKPNGLYSQVCSPSYMLYHAYEDIDRFFGSWETFNYENV